MFDVILAGILVAGGIEESAKRECYKDCCVLGDLDFRKLEVGEM